MLDRTLIVIPCLNEEAHLPALLEQLLGQSGEALIVVADGGSSDRSRAIVTVLAEANANLHLLDNGARLQSAGCNLAVRCFGAEREWMVRVDAHCGYPDHYAAKLVETACAHDATSVVVPMVTQGVGCFQRAVAAAQNSKIGTGGSPHRHLGTGRFVDHGHHALMRLDLYREVGGYDESFVANEDAELDARLLAAGGRIWLEPSLALTYRPRATPGALARQYYRYGLGRARMLQRHKLRLKSRQVLPLAVPPVLVLALLSLLISPFASSAIWLALPASAWGVLCLAAGLLIGIALRDRCAAGAGIAAMLMHAAWGTGFLAARVNGRTGGPGDLPAGAIPPSAWSDGSSSAGPR